MSGHPPRANRDGPVSKLTSILLATSLLGATQPASATQPADAQEMAGARCPRTLDLVRLRNRSRDLVAAARCAFTFGSPRPPAR